MKKILITGSSGFIGSFLVEEAINRGYEVYAGVRSKSNRQYLQDPQIIFFDLDFSDKEQIKQELISSKKKIGPFNYIIHNAGITKSLKKDEFDIVNYQYTKNFIEVLIETNTVPDKFIYISSLAAYGPGSEKTMRPVLETDIARPVTLYGKSKLKAEQFISGLPEFPYIIIRPTGVYGPREKDYFVMYKMINRHLETYIGSPNQHITFIYVKDLARLILDATKSEITGKSYFATDGNKYTTKEFLELVKYLLNKKTFKMVFPKWLVKPIAYLSEKFSVLSGNTPTLNIEKYKEISCKNWLVENSATIADFNFAPEYDLKKGMTETLDWFIKMNMLNTKR